MIRDIAAKRLGAVPILQVARRIAAVIRLDGQRVIAVDVAGHARGGRGGDVHAGQGEAGDGVIEGGHVGPSDVVVAIRAV